MGFKKDEKGNIIPSPKQRAVLLYGQRLRGHGNVSELIYHLNALGATEAATNVKLALNVLNGLAYREYVQERRRLDPNWESPFEKFLRESAQQDEIM